MGKRDELRVEWNRLDCERRKATGNDKSIIIKKMSDIERALRYVGDIHTSIESANVSVTISVFEQNSCYRGPTMYGSTIGEGCYRRGSGHNS